MKYFWYTIIIIIIILLGIQQYIIFNQPPKEDDFSKKIDNLELKIDSILSIKDSVRSVIDSTHIKIITNEKHYQERINTIITQPSSADSSYVSNYIRLHRSQRDSNNIYRARKIKY